MRPSAAAAGDARRLRRIRGAATGTLAALGALLAHLVAGGSVELVPGAVVLAVVLPLGWALTRVGRVAPGRLLALAAAAQALGHLCLLMAPAGHAGSAMHAGHAGHAVGTPSATMVAGHLLVALAVTTFAAGLDRALIELLGGILARLAPLWAPALRVPATSRAAVPRSRQVRRTAGDRDTTPSRGPPRGGRPSPVIAPA